MRLKDFVALSLVFSCVIWGLNQAAPAIAQSGVQENPTEQALKTAEKGESGLAGKVGHTGEEFGKGTGNFFKKVGVSTGEFCAKGGKKTGNFFKNAGIKTGKFFKKTFAGD